MRVRKIIFSYIVTGFISMVLLGYLYLAYYQETNQTDDPVPSMTNYKTINLYKLYNSCDHLVKQREYEIAVSKTKDLAVEYPEEEGWSITWEGNNIKIVQNLDGFCPQDKEKRYLGVKEGFLAIYQGPANLDGPLQKITDIKVSSLPLEWQEKVYNKALEFASESELLEALDSLDEYQ